MTLDHPVFTRWPAQHADRLQLFSAPTPNGVKVGIMLEDTGLASMAIIQKLTGVIVWFRPGERLSVEDVAKTYLAMTMRLVGRREDAHVPEHA